jgi:hypothetical protein
MAGPISSGLSRYGVAERCTSAVVHPMGSPSARVFAVLLPMVSERFARGRLPRMPRMFQGCVLTDTKVWKPRDARTHGNEASTPCTV